MTIDWLTIAVPAIIFFATVIRSTFGFAGALFAMPLLTMTSGIHVATPLVALVVSTDSIAILLSNWREVEVRSAWRLVLSSLFGIPVGLLFLQHAYEDVVTACLAVVIIVFALYNLFKPRLLTLKNDRAAYIFGFVAGILGGAYNANGPPVVAYGTMRQWPAESFRATLQGYFFPIGLPILLGHALAGLWTADVFRLYLISFPFVLLANWIGHKLNRAIPANRFEQLVNLLLIVVGTMLLIH